MRESSALWFGGVLLGIGVGWYVFNSIDLSQNMIAWLFIILGAGVVLSGLMKWISPGTPFNRLGGSIAGGLVIALFMTQGFSFITGLSNIGGWGPYTAQDTKTFTGASTSPASTSRSITSTGLSPSRPGIGTSTKSKRSSRRGASPRTRRTRTWRR